MIKVSVFYPNKEGSKFDMGYYLNSHIPMVQKKCGASLKGGSVDQGLSGPEPGSRPAFVAMAHLLFDSVQAFQGAFGPHADSIMADIPNYTDNRAKPLWPGLIMEYPLKMCPPCS
jgi:uncharacterized protein (TIGR02118 family)